MEKVKKISILVFLLITWTTARAQFIPRESRPILFTAASERVVGLHGTFSCSKDSSISIEISTSDKQKLLSSVSYKNSRDSELISCTFPNDSERVFAWYSGKESDSKNARLFAFSNSRRDGCLIILSRSESDRNSYFGSIAFPTRNGFSSRSCHFTIPPRAEVDSKVQYGTDELF